MSWPTKSLADIAILNPRIPKDRELPDTVVFLPMAAISEHGEILAQELRPLAEVRKGFTYFARGDVLLAKITPCFENGKAAFLEHLQSDVGFGSTEFHVVRPNTQVLDGKYLFYMLWNGKLRHDGELNMTGSAGQRRVPAGFLERYRIPLPPLLTQRHIAKVLEQADRLRRQAQQMEAELDRLAQALFLEMFGNLFANPKQWPLAELGSLIELGPKNGLYKHSDDYGSGTPIVRIDNFYAGELTDPANFKRVSLTEAEQEKFGLANHSILINRVNSPEYLGKVALVENLTEHTVFESNMMNFTVNQSRINPIFLVAQLGSQFIREHIRKASKDASNQSSINQGDVRAFRVVVPPIAEQNRFARLHASIRHVRNMGGERSSMLEQAFQSLMQRALNGELTPKVA